MIREALFSPCGQYRYTLTRAWGSGKRALWVMLNPSTADSEVDDPTIRKCIGFTKLWGFDGMTVVNVFAWWSTDPKALRSVADPIGNDNDWCISLAAQSHPLIIAAWGAWASKLDPARVLHVRKLLKGAMCLLKTKSGEPGHPLYVPYGQQLELA